MRSTRRILRRALGAALASLIVVTALGPGGAAPNGDTPTSALAAPAIDANPAEIDPLLGEIEQTLESESSNSSPGAPSVGIDPADSDPGTAETDSDGTGPDQAAEIDADTGTDDAWLDPRTGRAEVLVLFDDAGVADASLGDAELAAASLQSNADSHWDRVDDALEQLEADGSVSVLNRFWVTSAVLLSADTDAETLAALADLPGAASVVPNYTIEGLADETPIPMSAPSIPSETTSPTPFETEETPITYGLERINADDAWRDYGVAGQGVRVAVLDTGVDATHPEIGARLVGRDSGDPSYPGGWINFDRTGNPIVSKPTDPGSHGTHVAGTVLGGSASGTRIGVAPEAELMAANVLSGGGSTAKIFAALQWVIEPYDGNGQPAGRAADVINMSLGSGRYDASLIQPIRNLRDAGIFPAIAIGNAPCGPNGTSSPGDIYESFGVGMTDDADNVNPGSCGAVTNWDPVIAAQYDWPADFVKPDASAPGTAVFSTMPNGQWGEATGTSMATPHVAGAVALLRSAQAGLTIDEIEHALESTAFHPAAAEAPDTRYGWGRIDVHAAIASVLGESGISGTVVDQETGAPVAGADVSYGEHGETWRTDAAGRFTARLVPGTYALDVSRFGFESTQSGQVTVAESGFTELEIGLTRITTGAITGTVIDHSTGEPIPDATVRLMGQPISVSTAADGTYRLDELPAGAFRVKAEAPGMRDAISDEARVSAALTTTVDFALSPLERVLVLGDNEQRTTQLLAENDFNADSLQRLPEDLSVLAEYDTVVWDSPGAASAEQLNAAIDATDEAGTGIVWLDLGVDKRSGIASLHAGRGDPAIREGVMDRSIAATGYRVLAEHPIFAGGMLSNEPLTEGTVLEQYRAPEGPKFYAWFEELTGTSPTVLGETVILRTDSETGDPVSEFETVGHGIAVDERAENRHVFLSLHGTEAAVDARSWSLASTQLFVNATSWAANFDAEEPDPDPEVEEPEEPNIPPGDGGNGNRPGAPGAPSGRPDGGATVVGTAPRLGGGPSAVRTTQAPRAPSTQTAPKPERTPDPPVRAGSQLTRDNAGGITLRVESGIAHVSIPDSAPGDWFFLHVYPGAIPVDWIRVNDDGELRIDISSLPAGTFRLVFSSIDDELVGWVEVTIDGPRSASTVAPEAPGAGGSTAPIPATTAVAGEASPFQLSTSEQLMLLGAALLLLAAAGVVLLGLRNPRPGPTA